MIDERYIILIHKRLRQELSEEDQFTLQNWLDESSEHQRVFQEMESTWKLSADYLAGYSPNVEQGLASLRKRIQEDQAPVLQVSHRKKRSRISFTSAIAASLLLLIAALAVWNFWFRPAELLMVSTMAGEQKTLTLDDGSVVILNENSQLTYPSFFRHDRQVELSGEAFFEITRDEENSFSINTSKTKTEVLGTSFNLRAYDDELYTEVEVVKGLVRLADFEGLESLDLEEGFRGTYHHREKTLLPDQPKTLNANYWKERRLRFRNHQLSEAIREIQSRLDLEIQIVNPELSACSLTLAIDIDELETNIIATLADIYSASWSETPEGGYIINGGNCDRE